jgi:rhodanese-related sulfurtransferase
VSSTLVQPPLLKVLVGSSRLSLIGIIVVFFILTTLLWAPGIYADERKLAPLAIPGSTVVDAEKLIELVGIIPNLLLIDARIRMDRKQGYIEGSISLPDIETDCNSLARIISSKAVPILFYCNGQKCARSGKSVIKANECGYKNVFWFRGGMEEWNNKNYPVLKQ